MDIINYNQLTKKLDALNKEYNQNKPFPNLVIDNFLKPETAEKILLEFPNPKDQGWVHYLHYNEKKHALSKMDLLPPFTQKVIQELNSDKFLAFLSKLTGIENLKADEMLEGGGLHQSPRGGFLNIHADFTVHPHKANWQRRVNILIYFNKNWEKDYNGELELWSRDMKKCEKKIAPIFNRCVLFNTDKDSFHGLPELINCPPNETRKSLALYYFTLEKNPVMHTTNYQGRPGDGMKNALIYLDKKAVEFYTKLKGRLGSNDDFISKILDFFSKK